MLTVQDVKKTYGEQPVLKGVSLSVGEREMISIMGKSGAGKSTLLAVIAGLVRPDSGSVVFREETVSELDEEKLASFRLHHIGFIFQDFKLIPALNVYENILLAIYPRRDVPGQEKDKRINELVEKVGLSGKLNRKVDNLSGGEKQRVAIARSLVNQPDLILADEPTGNLDTSTAEEIMDLFLQLHTNMDTTFLIITHDRDIAAYTAKAYILKDGELVQ